MKRLAIGLALILASTTAGAQSVEVASGDWSNIPTIRPRGVMHMGPRVLNQMHDMAAREVCTLPGFTQRRIDLAIPFIIRFTPAGGVERLVVRDVGCRELETLVAGLVLRMTEAGEFSPTGTNRAGWYRSELSFVSM